ncbi:MAG: MipA/OmpV family protein [Rhodospirillales bacterium]|nr:MipA/OmpV family protein [Rhodospirillales bacterium]
MLGYPNPTPILAAILAAATTLGTAFPAAAEDGGPAASGSDWKVSVGLGTGYKPDYEGSDDYDIDVMPDLSVSYRDLVYFRHMELGANALTVKGPRQGDKLQLGPLVRFRPGRDQDDNKALSGLGDVDYSIEAGAFLRYGAGPWSAGLTFVQDMADGHDGALAEASVGYGMTVAPGLKASLTASTTWASDDYMQSFFGISAAQAASSGRAAYEAEAGIKNVGLTLGLEYEVMKDVGLGGRIGYSRLLGDAADSPLVEGDGSADQFSAGVSLNYRF